MEDIPMNIKKHWVGILTTIIIVVILLMVTFAKANEGLDQFEKNDLKNITEQYLSKGAS